MQLGRPKPLMGVQLRGRPQPREESWFSMASSLSMLLSQLMWKRVTRGLRPRCSAGAERSLVSGAGSRAARG